MGIFRKQMQGGRRDVSNQAASSSVWKGIRYAAVATFAVVAAANPALAQSPRVLKLAHVFPATHYLWTQGGQVFANEVEKASGGRIKFEVYPAGQLGKDLLALFNSGLADLAILIPSYAPEKFPLTSVAELPGLHDSSCDGTARLWNVAKPGAMLSEGEFKSLGFHPLFVNVLPPYGVMTTSKSIANLDVLAGLKIRANGPAMDKTVRSLGAVPVRVSSPELYDALTRGTVDGAFFAYQGLIGPGLQKILKYSVTGAQLGAGAIVYGVSTKTWNGLPDDVKQMMTKAGLTAQETLCKWSDAEDAKAKEKIVAQDGHTLKTLSPQEAAQWNGKVSAVAEAWTKEMDAAGKKGSELLRAYKGSPAAK